MYPDKNSMSASLANKAASVMPGGNSRHSVLYPPYPVYASSGDGCHLTDVDGVTRIDCVNNMSALIHGHKNATVLTALREQAEQLLCAGAPTAVELELAEIIVGRIDSVDLIRFTSSGSDAVMFACRAARAHKGRDKIAKVEGAYHGSYDAVEFGLSPDPGAWGEPSAPSTVPATLGISKGVQDDTIILPFNDVAATEALLTQHAADLAAVLIDPLVSRMGFIPATPEYLELIRDFTKDNGSVLIFDEVFSFRMGYHGGQGVVGIKPDLTVLGKVIGGGLPIGAVGGSCQVMEVFDHQGGAPSVEHSGTYFANPMSMAAGTAALKMLTPDVLQKLNTLGDLLRSKLQDALQNTGSVGYVAGAGSLTALVLGNNKPQNYREMFAEMAGGALEKGMILHRFLLNEGVQIIPPGGIVLSTPMTEDTIEEIVAAVRAGLEFINKQAT